MKNQKKLNTFKKAALVVGLSLSAASIVSCSQEENLNLEGNENFSSTNESFATPADNKFYTIRNRSNGRILDISGGSNDNGANLQVWGTDSNTSVTHRQWEILSISGDYYRLKGVDSGKSIEIADGNNDNGANAQQSSYDGSTHQQWEFISTGSGYFRIKNRDSGKSLRVIGSGNGSNADQASWDGGENQQWFFTEIGSSNDVVDDVDNIDDVDDVDDDNDDSDSSTGGSGSANAIIGGNWKLNAYSGNLSIGSNDNGLDYEDDASKSDNDDWFYDQNGYAYFKCYPGNPTSTDNTSNPRTELREENPDGSLANWDGTDSTEHSMKWKVRIDDLPPSGKLAFGQIHAESGSDFDDVIRTQVQGSDSQNSGEVTLRVLGYVTEELLGSGQSIDFDMRMDTEYYFEITMRNSIVRFYSLNSDGSRDEELFESGSVRSDGNYFKAGVYLQSTRSSDSDSSTFGLVGIKDIEVAHN